MQAKTEEVRTLTLQITPEEARTLISILQNPAIKGEDHISDDLRCAIFYACEKFLQPPGVR